MSRPLACLLLLSACAAPDDPFGYNVTTDNPSLETGASSSTGDDDNDTATGDDGDTGSIDDSGPPDTGTGYDVGDTAYDLTATAQSGRPWSLYDQFGTPVILLLGHADVGAAMTEPLGYLDAVASDTGALSVVVLGRDEHSTVADTDDAQRYASLYGVDVVLTDPNLIPLNEWGAASAPRAVLIDEGLTIQWAAVGFGITEAGMRAGR